MQKTPCVCNDLLSLNRGRLEIVAASSNEGASSRSQLFITRRSTCSLTYACTCSSDEDAGAISAAGEGLEACVCSADVTSYTCFVSGGKRPRAWGWRVVGRSVHTHRHTHSGKHCTHTHPALFTHTHTPTCSHTHTVGSSVHTHTHTHTHTPPLNRNLSRVRFQIY